MSNITHVTDASFEAEVIKSEIPVLVDFWAEWCGPCRMLSPILDEIANEYQGKLKIVKVNVESREETGTTVANHGIRGIPALLLFKNGQVIGTKVGSIPKGQLSAFIDSNI